MLQIGPAFLLQIRPTLSENGLDVRQGSIVINQSLTFVQNKKYRKKDKKDRS